MVLPLDRPPPLGLEAVAHIDPDDIPCTGAAAGRPPSYWEEVDIATSLEDTVEEGIAREEGNKGDRARGEEDRRTADTGDDG